MKYHHAMLAIGFLVIGAGCASHVHKCLNLSPDDEIFKSPGFFQFKDPGLLRYALGHWDKNEDCSLTQDELDAVKVIPKNAMMMTDDMRRICNKDPKNENCLQVYSIEELKLLRNLETIEENAFYNQGTIETVDHPNVRYLGWDAFGKNNVTTVNLPKLQKNTHPVNVTTCTPNANVPLTSDGNYAIEVPVSCIEQIPQNPAIGQYYFYFNNSCLHDGMSYLIAQKRHAYMLQDLDTVVELPQEIFSFAKEWNLCVFNCGEVNTYCNEECNINLPYSPCEEYTDNDSRERCNNRIEQKRDVCYTSCNHTGDFCRRQCRTNHADTLRCKFNENDCTLDVTELNYMRNLMNIDFNSFAGREVIGEFYPKAPYIPPQQNTMPNQYPQQNVNPYPQQQMPYPQ